ncbi:MAG: nucleotidyltransferase domain-containing protein [Candidatus Omnitrophota bacterium]
MQFELFLDKIIGSKAKIKILKYLFGHQASMSENELAKVIKLSPMTINRLMKELRELNLASMERIGNANVWSVNKESYAYIALSKIVGEISGIPAPLEHLKKIIMDNIPEELAKKVILYGSLARGKSKVNSDIDLFILVETQKEAEELATHIDRLSGLCLCLYGNRLAPYILTEAQLQEKKELFLLKEIEKGIRII